MMSSLPSLSQSISPTPPLIDSTMYFLSGEEICVPVSPDFCATSSNHGMDCWERGSCASLTETDGVADGLAGAACASSIGVINNSVHRKSVHTESKHRIGRHRLYRVGFSRLRVIIPAAARSLPLCSRPSL